MRIIHIAYSIDLITPKFAGGRGRFIYNLAKKQAEEGHEVYVISAPGSQVPGCKVLSISDNFNWISIPHIDILHRRIIEYSHIYKAYKIIDSKFDVVHNHVEWEGSALSRILNNKSVTTIHGMLGEKLLGKIYSQLCNRISNTFYVTQSKIGYISLKPIYRNKLLSYIYPALDFDLFAFKNDINNDYLKMCCVGRIVPEKGFHNAIELADILNNRNYPIHLNLIGMWKGGSEKYLRSIIQKAERRSYVSLSMNVPFEKVMHTYQHSNCTLMPIEWEEIFGFVAVESLACGTPVICYNKGALNEIVSNGETGFMCNSLEEMFEACLHINELDRNNCRKSVEKKFSINKLYNAYLEVYNIILG